MFLFHSQIKTKKKASSHFVEEENNYLAIHGWSEVIKFITRETLKIFSQGGKVMETINSYKVKWEAIDYYIHGKLICYVADDIV